MLTAGCAPVIEPCPSEPGKEGGVLHEDSGQGDVTLLGAGGRHTAVLCPGGINGHGLVWGFGDWFGDRESGFGTQGLVLGRGTWFGDVESGFVMFQDVGIGFET